jgi:hypothetical protein
MTFREQAELSKKICKEEAALVSKKYGADFSFDHYDSEVKILFVRESDAPSRPVSFAMVKPLQERLQKEIHNRYTVGILCSASDE